MSHTGTLSVFFRTGLQYQSLLLHCVKIWLQDWHFLPIFFLCAEDAGPSFFSGVEALASLILIFFHRPHSNSMDGIFSEIAPGKADIKKQMEVLNAALLSNEIIPFEHIDTLTT